MKRFLKGMTPIKRLLLLNAVAGGENLTELTETGNPVTFSTDVAKALKECTVLFTPVQSGSGDPSPENVRPITGWTGLNVWRTGKNLYGYDADNIKVNPTYSGSTLSGNRASYHTGIYGDGTTRFTFSATRKDASVGTSRNINIGVYRNSSVYITAVFIKESEEQSPTVKPNAGEELVFVTTNDSTETLAGNIQKYDIQAEIGSSATTYAPYSGTSYPVTFPAEAGTVYGGSLDLTTGVLTAEYISVNPSGWTKYKENANDYYCYEYLGLPQRASTQVNISNATKLFVSITSDTVSSPTIQPTNANGKAYAAFPSTFDISGLQWVYKLATAQTWQLTPQQITSLIGDNTIWSDANGDLTVKYLKKG